ncbi:MAG: zinc-ribbon domain-containing protein [Deltaproteobacteria bacterium]|nr:zinc-ribbon domain-containing protein [Deltaproteobacteria bacterium]
MEVRCEKCQAEHELDDAKVTEAGVTVKCAACGHLFKVRRAGSRVGPMPTAPGLGKTMLGTAVSPVTSKGSTAHAVLPLDGANERQWMIRTPTGEIRHFRELTTLQQWIVERKINRNCEISRTGETWKRLGEVAELASFFLVVDQAEAAVRAAVAASDSGRIPAPMPFPPSRSAPISSTLGAVGMRQPPPRAPDLPAIAAHVPTGVPQPIAAEPSGPKGSLLGGSVTEAAWAAGGDAVRRTRAHMESQEIGNAAADVANLMPKHSGDDVSVLDESDLLEEEPKRRPKGLLYAAWALLLLGGGGAGAFFALSGGPKATNGGDRPSQQVNNPDQATALAATQVVPSTKAQAPAPESLKSPAPANTAVVSTYDEGLAKFYEDTDQGYAQAEQALEKARVADPEQDARVLAAMALVNSSWAQYLVDDAKEAEKQDKRLAEQLAKEAARKLQRAEKFAQDAIARGPKNLDALVAMADVRRQKKGGKAEIEKLLTGAAEHPETPYVRGMFLLREGKKADAITMLSSAAATFKARTGKEHLRARVRLAHLDLEEKRFEEARRSVELVLVVQKDHGRARALARAMTRLTGQNVAGEVPDTADDSLAGDYDSLVKKGNRLAENGRCRDAVKVYEKALEDRPGGVDGLTGLGYCHLDAGEHSAAQAKFRAAIGISPRFGDALIGMAETYRFQGQKEQALDYYRKYLDTNPAGPKAGLARRYVQELSPEDSEQAAPSPPGGSPSTPPPGTGNPQDPPRETPSEPAPPPSSPEEKPTQAPSESQEGVATP